MRIALLTYGSRGDVQPFLALAVHLQKFGYQVTLAAPYRFETWVKDFDIECIPLVGDPEEISQRLNDAGNHPIGMALAISEYVYSIADQVIDQAFIACNHADLIIHSFLFTTGGHSLARKLGVPDISVQTFPIFATTSAIPPVYLPNLSAGFLRNIFHNLTTQVFWHGGNLAFKRLRKTHPESFDLKLFWPFANRLDDHKTPLVFAFSPTIIPHPADWCSSSIHIPGYFFLDTPDTYRPPADLMDFLAAGKPPLCITFGSMINRQSDYIYQTLIEALSLAGERAIILSGWGERLKIPLTQKIFVSEVIPHDWLLLRCKMVIHHGGAGTTAAGLRAGIPNIVIPFAADQPFWGERVFSVGAGPRPIPLKQLTGEKIIAALSEANSDELRHSARKVGESISAEDGLGKMLHLIEQRLAEFPMSTTDEVRVP